MSVKCTGYYLDFVDDHDGTEQCHCPVCGGFLSWNNGNPICNKCHTPLITLPDHDEETGEELETGRICPIPSRDTLHSKHTEAEK